MTTDSDVAFAEWYKREFGYELTPDRDFGQDAVLRSAFASGASFERKRALRILAEKEGIRTIESIPTPFNFENVHRVVAKEFPPGRPNVVDLVFDDGLRMAETKGAKYAFNSDRGFWTLILSE